MQVTGCPLLHYTSDMVSLEEDITSCENPDTISDGKPVQPTDNKKSSNIKVFIDDEEMQEEWDELQESDIDFASIYDCSQSLSDCKQLLMCTDILIALILGCLLCSIFSRYVRN